MMIDEVIAEQMSMDEWQEAGAQPEDEPTEEDGTAKRFLIITPKASGQSLTMPERAEGHDLILPGDSRRAKSSPRTPRQGAVRRKGTSSSNLQGYARNEVAEQRSGRRMQDDQSWIQNPAALASLSQHWTPQKRGLAQEIQNLRTTNKSQSKDLAKVIEESKRLEVGLQASSRSHLQDMQRAERDRAELEGAYFLR